MAKKVQATHPTLVALKKLVPGLARALGNNVEVVLHEFSHPENSVIAMAGNVTGRQVGAPLTDLILRHLRQGTLNEDLINYPSCTSNGKELKSSTLLIRDEQEQVIGCLCINLDITKWLLAKSVIGGYCHTEALSDERSEAFTPDIESFLFSSIEQAVEQQDIPVALMKKSPKIQVVKELDEQGVFLLRGAVAKIAKSLHVSRYTVYNYLEEIRNSSERMLRQ